MCVQILCFPRENYSNFVSPNIHSMSFHAVDVDVSHRVPFRYAIRQQLHLKMTASPSGNTAATKAKKSYKIQKPHSKHCVARWKFSECFKCFVRASAAWCFCLLASRNSWCSADAKLNMLGCTQHQSIPPDAGHTRIIGLAFHRGISPHWWHAEQSSSISSLCYEVRSWAGGNVGQGFPIFWNRNYEALIPI